ncbi:peptidoglycan-binding protein [Desulfocurvus sp. DL9XJH121]
MQLTKALRQEYSSLFTTCVIKPTKADAVEATADALLATRGRYETVGADLGVPWYVAAVIHSMESSRNFNRHLHNGDPLSARTVHEPAGRPKDGNPPFTWEQSAEDALRLRRMDRWTDWSVPGCLFQLEGYNGWGYRLHHPHVLTPYLWSDSSHYVSGKYVADGTFSETAVSKQTGAAVLLRRLAERRDIVFAPDPGTVHPEPDAPALVYDPHASTDEGKRLQAFLNTFPGVHLKEDGYLGARSSEALLRVTGHRLSGDPAGD